MNMIIKQKKNTIVPNLDFGRFTDVINFLMELDKLKSIYRKNALLNRERYENTAEHSWHFAVAALSFAPYAPHINIVRVVKMALLHDIVEIDAGDVIVFDLAAREAIQEQEVKAAKRLFGLLPEQQRNEFLSLWHEYESESTADGKFAKIIDRIMPILMNLHNQGQSWVENQIRFEQVIERTAFIQDTFPELWEVLLPQLNAAKEKGYLLP